MATSEVPTVSVESVRFGFFTDEEVRKLSSVVVTSSFLIDGSTGKPVNGGLYDKAMGPLGDEPFELCQTCGLTAFICAGHCGHIDLTLPAYNPLLFKILHKILQRTCFFCYHFRTSQKHVEKHVSQLKLIMKGDVLGAKGLEFDAPSEYSDCNRSDNHSDNDSKQHAWTSLQFMEIMSVLDKALQTHGTECEKCKAKNPKIIKPTFGWFRWVWSSILSVWNY